MSEPIHSTPVDVVTICDKTSKYFTVDCSPLSVVHEIHVQSISAGTARMSIEDGPLFDLTALESYENYEIPAGEIRLKCSSAPCYVSLRLVGSV